MRIILFGARGLLGSELSKAINTTSHELFVYDREQADLTETVQIEKIFQEVRPEFVINATGYTDVEGAEKNPGDATLINAVVVNTLARLCKKHDIPLLHFSTDYVFDGEKKDGYTEVDKPHPLNAYGHSKARGEELIQATTDKFFIVRTSWLYGKNGKNFVDTILKLAQEKKELEVVDNQFGKPTYAKDLAEDCLQFLESKKYGIYHLTNEDSTSWYEFAKEIITSAKIRCVLRPTNRPRTLAQRPHYAILKNTKLPPLRPWKEALADYLNSK